MPILNSRAETQKKDGETFPYPELLARMGPVVPVTLHLPDQSQKAFVERGEKLPEPVTGSALIDTGASKTCLDINSARRACLPQIGVAQMTSATHANHQVPTFSGKIVCPMFTIDVEQGMGANLSSVGEDLIALLGRDILQSAILIYNGPDGHFSLAI